MDERRNKITSKQLMVFIISSQVGISIFCMPYGLSKRVGHDGWIAVLFSGIASILLSILVIKLVRRYGNKSLYDINTCLYGKYLGNAVNIIIIIYLGMKGVIALRFLVEVMKIEVLRTTPPLVLTPLIMIPSIYVCWYGLKALCRFSTLIFGSIFMVIALFAVNIRYVKPEFLMPVAVCSIPSILNAMLGTAYAFLSFANVAVFYPYITDKSKVLKSIITAIIFSTLFFMASSIVTTGFFGENMLKHLVFPILALAESYKAPVLERIELFFLAIWFPALAMTLRMYLFVTYNSINRLLNIKRKTTSLILVVVSFILLSRIPRDFAQIYLYMEAIDTIGIPLVFGLTSLNFILSFIIKKGMVK